MLALDSHGGEITIGNKVTYDEYPGETFEVIDVWSDNGTIMIKLRGDDDTEFDIADYQLTIAG